MRRRIRRRSAKQLASTQRTILFWDVLRRRSQEYYAHKEKSLPSVLMFDADVILDDAEQMKNFVRMEKWIFDSPDQAGEAFRAFVKDFFQNNGLMKGEIEIGGRTVDLRNITMPVMNVFATEDHLVPPDASKALKACVGTDDYREVSFRGGHIGIYVSGRAQRDIPAAIDTWLRARA